MRGPVIGSLGELLVEFICDGLDGHHLRAGSYTGPFPSGAPGIFIDQAARVGARAVFAGAVGDDAFGVVLRDRLVASGVSRAMIEVVPGVPTGSAFVSYNSDGSRDFVFNIARSAASHFPAGAAAVAKFLAAGVEVLHISGSTLGDPEMRSRALEICRSLKAAGVAISVDPNIRNELMNDAAYLAVVRELIGMADFVLPSDADADLLFDGGFTDWAPGLIDAGARVVALKRGAAGAIAMDGGGRIVDLPGHAVPVVDPTGAGDCFCATLVTLLAHGQDMAVALRHANAAGALAVGRLGPMEGNSDLATITTFLERMA